MSRLAAGLLLIAVLAGGGSQAQGIVPQPDDYRNQDYRAPVPAALNGARVLTTREAAAIWRDKSGAFVDVLPRPPKPASLPPDTVWRDKPRHNIPGSLWLPDTGYGQLPPAMEAYFRDGLTRASAGRRDALLVIYCQSDCWMSWNAARRAVAYGYGNIAWFPEGTDGWERAGLPLVEAEPEPRPASH